MTFLQFLLFMNINQCIKFFFLAAFMAFTVVLQAQRNYIRMADSEMKRNPEAWMVDFSKALKWNYTHGLVLQSIIQVYDKTDDRKYYDYVYDYLNTMINNDGSIKTYNPLNYNIDHANPGKLLFPVLLETKEKRFQKAVELLRNQMRTHPRTSTKSYWHKKVHPHQVWLDGLYMAGPFLDRYARENKDLALFDDVVYIFIQFGHNDEVPTKKNATTEAVFTAKLMRFVEEATRNEALPVLLTPVARRKFDAAGKVVGTHDVYSQIVREVAKAKKVSLIDLDKKAQSLYQNVPNCFSFTSELANIRIILPVKQMIPTLVNWEQG